jgi:putative membrane protein
VDGGEGPASGDGGSSAILARMAGCSPRERREIQILLVVFAAVTIWSAVRPHDLAAYLLELATPLGGAILLVATVRWHRFTPLAYRLMFLEGVILLVGAHFTHERVPLFDWLREPMGWERNHYDRFAHFAVGFLLAIPFRELILRYARTTSVAASVLAAVSVMALACVYEITEWWIAAAASPGVGAAYLGSQGDIWDAQKDMMLDSLGGIVSVMVLSGVHDRQIARRT